MNNNTGVVGVLTIPRPVSGNVYRLLNQCNGYWLKSLFYIKTHKYFNKHYIELKTPIENIYIYCNTINWIQSICKIQHSILLLVGELSDGWQLLHLMYNLNFLKSNNSEIYKLADCWWHYRGQCFRGFP